MQQIGLLIISCEIALKWMTHNLIDDMTTLVHIDGLVQEWSNSIANALELRLSWTNP